MLLVRVIKVKRLEVNINHELRTSARLLATIWQNWEWFLARKIWRTHITSGQILLIKATPVPHVEVYDIFPINTHIYPIYCIPAYWSVIFRDTSTFVLTSRTRPRQPVSCRIQQGRCNPINEVPQRSPGAGDVLTSRQRNERLTISLTAAHQQIRLIINGVVPFPFSLSLKPR